MSEQAFTVLSVGCLFVVGLGLGAASTVDDFKAAAQKPKAVGIGFASQYVFMPVFAFLLCSIFQVEDFIAIGTVLVGASPGGTTSNIFTYWSKGDVALSITMSLLSTLAAFGLMPLWIYILVVVAFDSDAKIPWLNIIVSLLLIIIPTLFGLSVRYYNTEFKFCGKFIWQWIELGTSVFGAIFLIAALVFSLIIYEDIFASTPWSVWVMALLMQPTGCAFGYFVAKAMGLPHKDQRTISLETGVQSFTLTIAVIALTFTGDELEKALMFPLAYGLLYFGNSAGIVAFYRWYLAPMDKVAPTDKDDEENAAAGNATGDLAVEKEEAGVQF
mmetsp:Transcript_26921/g.60190  ORF Transcript_26921/g.60190 Transcript_26921/m.60190 type:complete len:329 (-) Transcript_26921:227-1213(-)